MLELGVVGTPKELWARLNEDGGLPAATLLRLACHFEGLHAEVGERSRAVLESLKPGLLQSLDIDDPRRASQSAKAIAERRGRHKSIAKIQGLFRLARSLKPAAADPFSAFSRPSAAPSASGAASNFASLVRAAKLGNGLVANDSPRWAKAWGGAFGTKAGAAAAASVLNAQATGADALSKLKEAAAHARKAAHEAGPKFKSLAAAAGAHDGAEKRTLFAILHQPRPPATARPEASGARARAVSLLGAPSSSSSAEPTQAEAPEGPQGPVALKERHRSPASGLWLGGGAHHGAGMSSAAAAAAGAMVVLVAPEKEKRISAVRRAQMTLEAQDLTL